MDETILQIPKQQSDSKNLYKYIYKINKVSLKSDSIWSVALSNIIDWYITDSNIPSNKQHTIPKW